MRLAVRSPTVVCALAACGLLVLCTIAWAGTILEATCPCGFRQQHMAVGGGIANFRTFCGAPAFCAACKKMEVLNWLDGKATCTTCRAKPVFYNHPSLQEKLPAGAKPETLFSWNTDKKGTFELRNVKYRCPRCGKYTLRFRDTGAWD